MAITLDTSVDGGTANAATLSWSHTCTGSNLVLFVTVTVNTQTVTGITYGGVSMTSVGSQSVGSNNSYLYRLFGPSTGANNVIVTISGSTNVSGASSSYAGVYQGGIDSSNTNSSSATSITTATTTVTDNCWLVSAGSTGASTASSGANTTVRQSSGSIFHPYLTDSNAAQTPAGSKSQTVTCSNGSNTMIVCSIAPYDTNPRYWIGGTGTWDTTTKTHWSNSSGGASGATVPVSVNDAVFDASSGGGIATIGASSTCANLTMTGYTGTLAGSNTLTISGNMTLASGMTLTYSGVITLNSTALGKTITSSGKTILSNLIFNGVGGVWTMQDAMTISGTITLTAGTLALSTFTHTLSGTGTVWNVGGGSVTTGTSTLKLTDASASSKVFSGGGLTYYNLYLTGSGSGAYTIAGSNTFNDFKCDTPPHTINFTASTTQTLVTFTVSGTTGNLMTLQSTSSGTQWKLRKSTSGIVSCDYLSLRDSNVETL